MIKIKLKANLFGKTYEFKHVKEVLAKANEEKSGDSLAGIGAASAEERIAAKLVLSELTVNDLRNNPVVGYEEDEVTRVIQDSVNEKIFNLHKNKTISELREYILCEKVSNVELNRLSRGLTSEVVAGVTKLMSNLDLIHAAKKINVTAHCNTTIGLPGTFSMRLQPNHPTDSIDGIKASLFEGLTYGVGDAVLGVNPVDDSVGSVTRVLELLHNVKTDYKIPTQICVLGHVTTQMEAIKNGAPCDMVFQSLAGSQKGNSEFGFEIATLDEAHQLVLSQGTSTGPNVMYFETGQGSELSSNSHYDADQLTMEARCYGLAKRYHPFLVNTVVGFIGPEYLYDSKQVIRAGLEDHFMGKLTGIPMGVDVCYTNHMKADQNDVENLAVLLAAAGCNFVIGVPHGDDVMLNYQSTSYHDAATLREIFGLAPIKPFAAWLEHMGITKNGKLTNRFGDASIFLN